MGVLDWLRRRRRPRFVAPPPPAHAVRPVPPQPPVPVTTLLPPSWEREGFVVVDVETTGLVPTRDRVLEIAAIRTDHNGRIVDEWTTLLNPQGRVGASHVHGIEAADVRDAPLFRDIVGELNARLSGRALVAHNAPFDIAFMVSEYARVGARFPQVPYLCTLKASWTYLPDAGRRRLADLCWLCGIPLDDAHSALADARATAHLLEHYLDPRRGRPDPDHAGLPTAAARVRWPELPIEPARLVPRPPRAPAPVAAPPVAAPPGTLSRLLEGLPLMTVVDEGAPPMSQPYLEVLFQALEDGVLSQEEAESLAEVARVYALGREQVAATHRAFLMALAHRIVEDGTVTQAERTELGYACDVLGFADDMPRRILEEAAAAREADLVAGAQPLPEGWEHGEPLRLGDRVAFTGCDPLERARLQGRAQAAGLHVTGSVSGRTVLLVTDDAESGTSKAVAARRHGTRTVTPEVFAILVEHVQPPAADESSVDVHIPMQEAVRVEEPAAIRAWARAQGLHVGVRGRIPATVVAAYRASDAAGART